MPSIIDESKDSQLVFSALQKDASAALMIWPPVRCTCGRMVAFARNRDGKTRCIQCDAEYVKHRETPCR